MARQPREISEALYKDLKTKVVSWFSLVIGQNASLQLASSSENLVASAQFLVALATSESQFRALKTKNTSSYSGTTQDKYKIQQWFLAFILQFEF